MATRPTAPLGAPIWIDLSTSDIDRAQEFYSAIFGWTFESPGADYGGYRNAFADGRYVAGLMPNNPEWGMPDGWNTYLHTADVHATVAGVDAAGGCACGDPMEVPGKGWMAMVTDPSGAMVGLWQPTGHRGFEVVGEAGAPLWYQLTATKNYAATLRFYTELLGWHLRVEADTDEFRYTVGTFDGEDGVGVMDGQSLPDGTPSDWIIFFGVEDVDATLEAVVARGGSVTRGAEDTPYGRLAAATDPTGAAFNVSSLAH
ncbi:VOC family protein [Mycobacterium sp. MYCO198283]|uniref:VOC family protein n=1 Tax=Mycobacterium sp. MYCO198283 TaxID=2883505 RepID=UPI001E406828|nr:VOC family protein [Mycobacterium sp. MYCO198283]MCG5431083.1 VOC family protein [Mycobacterium sp. MYCO198283]